MVGEWLLRSRLRRLTLLGRTGLLTREAHRQLVAASYTAALNVLKADAGSAADAASVLNATAVGPFVGIMHAGGVLADATVARQSAAGIRAVFAPKAAAWGHATAALTTQPMRHSVLFSSVASLLGSPGQLNYSAANAWLDAAAAAQQAAGAAVLAVQFGAWKGGGMAAGSACKMEGMGLGALAAGSGLHALHGLLRAAAAQPGASLASARLLQPHVAMTPIDWPALLGSMTTPAPFFSAFVHLKSAAPAASGATAPPASSAPSAASKQPSATAGMSAEERLAFLTSQVEAAARAIVGASVGQDQPLMAAGLDSLGAVELRNTIESRLGLQLPSTLVFDYPTISAIAAFISAGLDDVDEHPAAAQADDVLATSALPASSSGSGPMVISGLATRSPEDALTSPRLADIMSAVPVSRWEADLQLTHDLPARFGGFVADAFLFDAAGERARGTAGRRTHTRTLACTFCLSCVACSVWHPQQRGRAHGPPAAPAAGDYPRGTGRHAAALQRAGRARGRVCWHLHARLCRHGQVSLGHQRLFGDRWGGCGWGEAWRLSTCAHTITPLRTPPQARRSAWQPAASRTCMGSAAPLWRWTPLAPPRWWASTWPGWRCRRARSVAAR